MTRNSISIYCYNFEAKECSEFTTLTDFLSYLNERDEFETYSTSKKRLTDTLGIEWEESEWDKTLESIGIDPNKPLTLEDQEEESE